jgi:hypothetical protein
MVAARVAARRKEIIAEAWASAPAPSRALAAPFSGGNRPPGNTPPISWWNDQMPPQPERFSLTPGYSDHTYQAMAAPYGFDAFTLDRIRNAVAAHRLGYFWESSSMAIAMMGFAPVLAALQQAIAPILALPRHVHGGDRGLAKGVAAEVEEQLVPQRGLLPSPFLPPSLWGTLAIYLRMLGFAVLQHVDGDPDPDTGIRTRYTRLWEPWAVNYYRSPRKWIALTTEGPVEIRNDGKFTLVIDEQEGHFTGAIVALGEEVLGGKLTWEAWLSYLDFFGKPKLYATLPEKVPTTGQAGDAFRESVETIYGPDGRGVLPHGSTVETVALQGKGGDAFLPAIANAVVHIAMCLLGTDGTVKSGGMDGTGAYRPAEGGPWNVRHDLIARPTIAIVRALNMGHVAPYCDINYGDAIERAKRAGAWTYPTLRIPLVAPDRDQRIESLVKREAARTDIIASRRANGIVVTQEEANRLAEDLEVRVVPLAEASQKPVTRLDLAPTDLAKVVRVDEARASRDLPPIGDERGDLTISELEAKSKAPPGETNDAPPQGEATGGAVE